MTKQSWKEPKRRTMRRAHEAGRVDAAEESPVTMSSSSVAGAGAARAPRDYVGRLSGDVTSAGVEEEAESRDEYGAELVLELSLGASSSRAARRGAPHRCWLLTAKDLPWLLWPRSSPSTYSSISSSSVSSSSAASLGSGTKGAAADSFSPDASGGTPLHPPSSSSSSSSSMVVGWPPVRAFRMNCSLFNNSQDETKASHNGDRGEDVEAEAAGDEGVEGTSQERTARKVAGRGWRSSLFVKVNMEGDPIGRKVDLGAHRCYDTLRLALENMFQKPTNSLACSIGQDFEGSKSLYASSEFYLTYEDKDGDWMLAGDVPWGMFLDTVKRLRILRTCDAKGLVLRFLANGNRSLSEKSDLNLPSEMKCMEYITKKGMNASK